MDSSAISAAESDIARVETFKASFDALFTTFFVNFFIVIPKELNPIASKMVPLDFFN